MTTRDPRKLLEKLDDHLARGLEAAAGFCVARGHYEVTIEHLLLKLIEEGSGDVPRILAHTSVDDGRLWEALLERLEGFRSGNVNRPSFSPLLFDLFETALLVAAVHHDAERVRSGHVFEALLAADNFRLGGLEAALEGVRADDVREHFAAWTAGSDEAPSAAPRRSTAGAAGGAGGGRSDAKALERFTQNVTDDARQGHIDPVLGRDNEIRQAIDILSRRRKNNPLLVGEAGVGKTAVVEGLALRIAEGDVPDSLRDVELISLDLGALQAGAGMKGEFEERLKSVIREVTESAKPIILFIDEAHTLIGAGGSAGTGDAANLLKPALARGELRTLAATTWSEYKKHIEKDPALARRFQLIRVEEPSEEVAAGMLRGIKSKYEVHHRVRITDGAVAATAKLSHRYISGRQLPDKAVDLLDTAAARVKMTQSAKPAALEDVERRLAAVDRRLDALRRDAAAGLRSAGAEETELGEQRAAAEAERAALAERWERERGLAAGVEAARAALADAASGEGADEAAAVEAVRAEMDALLAELAELQGESPLVHAEVNEHVVAQVVSDWTGIPIGDMVKDEAAMLLALEERLGARVEGQTEAIGEISDSLRAAKAGMGNPEAPLGVFLLVGPSGVGKTETARALAELLFGGERFLVSINMSEYQEAHTVSQLKGSPPGYVGYGEGGVLTEAVRQRPYAVVLLDEVEKAHPDVMELFFQVFDRGILRDGEGREITFANTVIMATSNVGTELITGASRLPERPAMDDVREAVHEDLIEHFPAALLGRMKVVPFFSLSRDAMGKITRLKLGKIDRRLREAHGVRFVYGDEVVERIAERCTQVDAGARNIDFIIDRAVLPDASRALLRKMAEGAALPAALVLGFDEAGAFTYTFTDDPDAALAEQAARAAADAAAPEPAPDDEAEVPEASSDGAPGAPPATSEPGPAAEPSTEPEPPA